MSGLMLGIDVGGTSVKIGLIHTDGNFIDKWEIPTNKKDQGSAIIQDIWASITERLPEKQLKQEIIGIGVGVPGFVNQATGMVNEAVNIGWKKFNVREEFERLSNLPVFVENDANLAALAEHWKGSGDNSGDLLFVTLGTGVGGGIIANGDILNGAIGTAGEIGHILVERDGHRCNCGKNGCLETIASATGIVRLAMEEVRENPNDALASQYKKQGSLEAKDVFDLAVDGDEASQKIIDHITDVLGLALANIAVTTNPSQILIGGGVSKAGEPLLRKIDDSFRKYALPRASEKCEVKLAELGNDAGMIGAAYLVKTRIEN